LDALRPIGVHLSIFMVETFELQLQIGSAHQRVVDGWFQLEHVIAHGQVVL
jgi:hypothetical protein